MNNTKLIVLRGPSGSGKTTIARKICDILDKPFAYIEQDYFRRIVLKEKDIPNGFNIDFIKQTIIFLLDNERDVIVEGIFVTKRYEQMFKELLNIHPNNNYFFYLNISLEETLKRHQTKINKDDFGENEMRQWYKDKDFLTFIDEEIILESNTINDSIKQIINFSDLSHKNT